MKTTHNLTARDLLLAMNSGLRMQVSKKAKVRVLDADGRELPTFVVDHGNGCKVEGCVLKVEVTEE